MELISEITDKEIPGKDGESSAEPGLTARVILKHCEWCNLTESKKRFLLKQGEYWSVYLADKQDYIGRCILVLNRHCGSLSQLDSDEWSELKVLIERLEKAISASLGSDMFNWSCLMNDFYKSSLPEPHLHIHVRPRYSKPVGVNGKEYYDEEYAHHYDNHKQNKLTQSEKETVYNIIREYMDGMA